MPSATSFIDANEMTPMQLGTLLKSLSDNEEEYLKYMSFKQIPLSESFKNITIMSYAHPNVLCRLCEYAADNREGSKRQRETVGTV